MLEEIFVESSSFETFEEIMRELSREFTAAAGEGSNSIFHRNPEKKEEAFKLINYIDHQTKKNGKLFSNFIPTEEFARVVAWARRILSD